MFNDIWIYNIFVLHFLNSIHNKRRIKKDEFSDGRAKRKHKKCFTQRVEKGNLLTCKEKNIYICKMYFWKNVSVPKQVYGDAHHVMPFVFKDSSPPKIKLNVIVYSRCCFMSDAFRGQKIIIIIIIIAWTHPYNSSKELVLWWYTIKLSEKQTKNLIYYLTKILT